MFCRTRQCVFSKCATAAKASVQRASTACSLGPVVVVQRGGGDAGRAGGAALRWSALHKTTKS